MLIHLVHDSKREHVRLLTAGVVYLVVTASLIGLAIAIYNKAFDTVTTVTVQAERAGLQLAKFGDVRVNGALVGQVRAVEQHGDQAQITVALDPEAARRIPADTTVQILPTTLFGQKYLAFEAAPDQSTDPIKDGAVIGSDRVNTNVEISQLMNDLYPLLLAIKPAELNLTLTALATALDGRGAQIGESVDKLDDYLTAIGPHLPKLEADLQALAAVADTYDDLAPDLLATLDNLTVTGRTIVAHQQQVGTLLTDLTGLAQTGGRVLRTNEANLIKVGSVTEPVLRLLATYSPEFPCLFIGLDKYTPRLQKVFENGIIKQNIFVGTPQYDGYTAADRPVYGEVGHGPWCLGLPNPVVPAPPQPLNDGSSIDSDPPPSPIPGARAIDLYGNQYAGTQADQQLINSLLSAKSGRNPSEYGSLGALLYGPVVRERVSLG